MRRIVIKVIVPLFILLFSFNICLALDDTEPQAMPVPPMVRAMGGAFTAVANDEQSVFFNPAGYGTIEDDIISVFSLGIRANVFDDAALNLISALVSGVSLSDPNNMNTYLSNVTLAVGAAGPIYFGRVGNNFGFAFYDNLSFQFKSRPGGLMPYATLNMYSDVGFAGGYGMEIPFIENLYAGFNFKVLMRVKAQTEGTALAVMDSFADTSQLPIAKAVGFGADIGLLYKPISQLSFGLCAKDFFGTYFSSWQKLSPSTEVFDDSYIKPTIAFGVAFYPLGSSSDPGNVQDFVIALDYSDLLDYSNVLSNIKFGISFQTLKIINIRGGLDGGYLTAGIGFDLSIFHTNIVYYVDELGAYPGANPVQNLMFNIAFKW
ncbi:MAG: hypothetical protein JSV25_13040 [Spirochaetota bacterium]|nr:MAG: hypothetical protein JSV25_13040 [Spirochaetota bacterium]